MVAATLPSALGYVADLKSTELHLGRALRQMESFDLQAALGSLLRADIAAERAARAATSPVFRVWTQSGPLVEDAAALDTLVTAASDIAEAGIAFIAAGDIEDLSDVYRDGTFDLAAIERLGGAASSLRSDLDVTRARLEDVGTDSGSTIGRRIARARERLRDLSAGLERGETFMQMVPAFMGADTPRRYLLALQSPSEARGGGGLIGVYGVLSLDAGRLELTHVGPVEELLDGRRRDIDAPRWFVQAYGSFGSLRGDMRQVNLSPNFPPTAGILLETYTAATGDELDGVIAIDPLAIGELLRGTGPLRAPGWHRQITRDNVRRTLLHDIYRHFDYREREQNRYLRGLIAVFMDALSSSDLNVAGLIKGLGVATERQHLKLFATDPSVQGAIVDLGVDGDYRRAGPNVQVVFNNNFSANKVDFFLKRTVDTHVRLADDGSASVKVTVSLANEAPEGRTVLVRPLNRALPFGTNHMLLGLIPPRGATPGRVTAEGRTVIQIPRLDTDRPLTLEAVDVAAGAGEDVVYRYLWPDAWDPDAGRFTLTLWPQAAVRPDFFTLTVTGPPGTVWDVPPGWRATPGEGVETGGRLQEPFEAALNSQ